MWASVETPGQTGSPGLCPLTLEQSRARASLRDIKRCMAAYDLITRQDRNSKHLLSRGYVERYTLYRMLGDDRAGRVPTEVQGIP